jgi:Mrp family chromosome partitioning ATPase
MDKIERALQRSRAEREPSGQAPPAGVQKRVATVAPVSDTTVRSRRVSIDARAASAAGLLTPDLAGPVGHSMKMLRAMVMQRLQQHGWNTLAVVSAAREEGRTFIAANLAIAISAGTDHTALLVDLDLKVPRLLTRFGVEPEVGIDDCLAGHAAVGSAMLVPEQYPGLALLPARRPVAQSSELIGGQRAHVLFRELKQRYVNRVVIYDVPPMLAGDDALVFVAHADAVLLVVGGGRTEREDLVRCLDLLRHVPVLGTVLNGAPVDHDRHRRS